jgi:predicted dinucleotide-binding enzyme
VEAIGGSVRAVAFAEAARWCDVAALATLWDGTRSALELAGAANLAGKPVIDATNPLDFSHGPALALGFDQSGGERVQGWLRQSRVVKAFNTVTAPLMFRPSLPGGPPTMFIAGDDDAAKRTVTDLLREFGWQTVDIGGIDGARLLEPLAMLYIRHAIRANNWQMAFKLLGSN